MKGHTKNACNWMFNLLKLDYRKRNIFTFDDMVRHLDANSHVSISFISLNEFFCFFEVLQTYYRSLKIGETTRLHVFEIKSKKHGRSITVLIKWDDFDPEERVDDLTPMTWNRLAIFKGAEDRATRIANLLCKLSTLDPPGIPPINRLKCSQSGDLY